MIGELELELAIADANAFVGSGDRIAFAHAGIDLRPVQAYGERFAQVMSASARPYDSAAASGFLLGFRLGVLASRHERMED